MLSTILVLVPIFALILAGYLCRRKGWLGAQSASELNRFVVWLALPAVLFDIMANTSWSALYQPSFIFVFIAANGVVFLSVLLYQLLARKHLADASIEAMASAYPNVGFIGFPLLLVIFGKDSFMPTTIATIIVVCIVFSIAIALIEAGVQTERHPHKLALKVANAIFKNPLIVSPLLCAMVSGAGVVVPAWIVHFLKLLGAAASPCALVCLGAFLADQAGKSAKQASKLQRSAILLSFMKLVAQPSLTWVLAALLIPLPTHMRHMAVLLAALPTGTGPFMLAEYYQRDAQIASKVILISTIVSLVTLVAAMSMMGIAPI